jgi:hypothetical protein
LQPGGGTPLRHQLGPWSLRSEAEGAARRGAHLSLERGDSSHSSLDDTCISAERRVSWC